MTQHLNKSEAGNLVERCVVLASLLEVSGYPKPGNVHRTSDAGKTRYEHFLAGSVSIGPAFRRLAENAFRAGLGDIEMGDIGLGSSILEASKDALSWQKGGNVNLGIILLLAPLSAASGFSLSRGMPENLEKLRTDLGAVIRACGTEDSVAIYQAIRSAVPLKVLGKAEKLDVLDTRSIKAIRKENQTPLSIFSSCKDRDSICSEWTSDFSITFGLGYLTLREAFQTTGDINISIVHTFLRLLSMIPDSLIVRKSGHNAALEVSSMAASVLEKGGMSNPEGKMKIREMDDKLRKSEGALNPGTTADITAASLYLLLFEGWRP